METTVNYLMDFLNTDFDSMTESELVGNVFKYVRFVCHSADKYDFLSIDLKNEHLMNDIVSTPPSKTSEQIFEERTNFLFEIQNHLKSRVDKLISDNTSGGQITLMGEIRGKRKISVVFDQENGKRLLETFTPDDKYISTDLSLKSEKIVADLALVDLFFDYDVRVDNFGKCEHCGVYFFEASKRPRVYCTDACANAARQKKYRLTQKKQKKGTKKKA
jgi:hypothetical protein